MPEIASQNAQEGGRGSGSAAAGQSRRIDETKKISEKLCRECSKPFEARYVGTVKESKFCSEHCSNLWWGRRHQTEHPVLPKLDNERPDFDELYLAREQLIQLEKADPWRYCYQPPHWKLADKHFAESMELLISGGNRAGKTLWAGRKVVEALLAKDNVNVICCHTSQPTSVTVQQPAIYNFLPLELKATKKGKIHYLNYSRKNGFTDGSFILHNGSRCDFLNYTQSETTIEGREADLIWCDELVPQSWIETLRFRLLTRRGKLIVTQTPLEGVASVYKEFVAGAKIVAWDDAELLADRSGLTGWPRGKAPRVMECMNPTRRVVFFFTKDNPYNPYDEMTSKLAGAPVGQILVRAYGWATDQIGKAFSRFRPDVHVIPASKVPEGGTLYMAMDPAGARNWFCLWARIYEDGKIVILREFPDFAGFGEWAVASEKFDGKPGPAQTVGAGRGISEYRQLFRSTEAELGGEPLMRLIDPKAGGTPAISEAGGTTLIDLLAQDGEEDEGMVFSPAPGIPIDQRIAAINNLLAYEADKPITPLNEPKLYIVEDCHNLIWCLSEHTGRDGQKGASKDPIDCLGMLATSSLEHVGEGGLRSVGGGSY